MRYFFLNFQVDVLRKSHKQIGARCNHIFYIVQALSELMSVFMKLTVMPIIFVRRLGAVEKVSDAVKFAHKRNFRVKFLNETVFASQCLVTSHQRHSKIGIKTNGC